jgi:hypothetical protein
LKFFFQFLFVFNSVTRYLESVHCHSKLWVCALHYPLNLMNHMCRFYHWGAIRRTWSLEHRGWNPLRRFGVPRHTLTFGLTKMMHMIVVKMTWILLCRFLAKSWFVPRNEPRFYPFVRIPIDYAITV